VFKQAKAAAGTECFSAPAVEAMAERLATHPLNAVTAGADVGSLWALVPQQASRSLYQSA
jgi:hypothetical protein